jgi:hypothetical protein
VTSLATGESTGSYCKDRNPSIPSRPAIALISKIAAGTSRRLRYPTNADRDGQRCIRYWNGTVVVTVEKIVVRRVRSK